MSSGRVGILGGTGLDSLRGIRISHRKDVATPFGSPSAALTFGSFESGPELVFLARHGDSHALAPHTINYRANLWALRACGVQSVISVAAVGGITRRMSPGCVVIPEQIIDYTYGREHTIFDAHLSQAIHVDFTAPYTAAWREHACRCAEALQLDFHDFGVYGATQGPRLETAAEILRMERDGCDVVGMTGMPEAALARELTLDFVCVAVVVNWAAGKDPQSEVITGETIERNLGRGMGQVDRLLRELLAEQA